MRDLQVRQVDCANCGAKLDIRTGMRAKTFTCEYCGAVCENDQVVALQNQQEIKSRFAPQSFLKLGLKGKLLGQSYQIVGRIRLEGQDGYEKWFWDEWFLMSPTGFPLWLIEDEHGFSIMRLFVPTEFIDPYSSSKEYGVNGALYKVQERGMATITFLEGELTWRARPKEVVNYLDLTNGDKRLSMEYSQTEIQYTRGQAISPEALREAFKESLPKDVETPKKAAKPKAPKKFNYWLWGGAMAVTGVVAFLFSLTAGSFGTTVFSRTTPAPLNLDGYKRPEFQFLDSAAQKIRFKLTKGPVVAFKFRSSSFSTGGNESGWWVSATLYEVTEGGGEKEIGTINADFWAAEGYDEGEHWSESKYTDTIYVGDLDMGKEYYLSLQAGRNRYSSTKSLRPRLQVEVVDGAWNPAPIRYFSFGAMGLPAILLIIFLAMRSSDDD